MWTHASPQSNTCVRFVEAHKPAESVRWKLVRHQISTPQHIRVLANEMLATRLGLALGLPMPQVVVIEVSDSLIEHAEDLRIQLAGQEIPCRSGKQLGSLYVGSPGMTLDYLPASL